MEAAEGVKRPPIVRSKRAQRSAVITLPNGKFCIAGKLYDTRQAALDAEKKLVERND